MTYTTLTATNNDLACFLGVGNDTRREILRELHLPKRRHHPWAEIWSALGLLPEQPEELWHELTLGAERRNVLWDAARVADEIGYVPATVNRWCQGERLAGFPSPLIDLGPKRRWWLPLEVRAYHQPFFYGALAGKIRKKPDPTSAPTQVVPIACIGTLQPLPPLGAGWQY